QVFIEAYPEPRRQLNYRRLGLCEFDPGAFVRCDGGLHLVSDPIRRPGDVIAALESPVGEVIDKIKVGMLRVRAVFESEERIFKSPEVPTLDFLRKNLGLGSSMVERFFTPFYQGIFLSPLEEQSSRMFRYVFKMFAIGAASLPDRGIGAVPNQIAMDLPEGGYLVGRKASASLAASNQVDPLSASVAGSGVLDKGRGRAGDSRVTMILKDGREVTSQAVVVATEAPAAVALLGESVLEGGGRPSSGRSSTCLYFGFDGPPPV
ncbi:unnamed protein product, partial [Choristocarpus tenellus]